MRGKVPKCRSGHSPIVPPLFRSWPAARWRFCSCLRRSRAWSLPGTSSTRTTRTRNSRLRQQFCPDNTFMIHLRTWLVLFK
ncbi:hypothetical protein PVAP13_4NG167200 [Panicum virgatum]|uniref:Uncharacterized protein n=1 Tax=Panicum virgatum TaxID=38727 RepID=A0A8T0TB71_PANVG|nr:hypothetical protein PVAP13_4NG167200 [Panicum virgatum]